MTRDGVCLHCYWVFGGIGGFGSAEKDSGSETMTHRTVAALQMIINYKHNRPRVRVLPRDTAHANAHAVS